MTMEDDGSISTTVCRKPTHTNKYLEFLSHHPTVHQSTVVRALFNRAEKVLSSLVEKTAEERRLFEALQKNGYPKRFISCRSRRPQETEQRKPIHNHVRRLGEFGTS